MKVKQEFSFQVFGVLFANNVKQTSSILSKSNVLQHA